MVDKTVGSNLRIVRKRNGLTQSEAAKIIGSSLVSYSEYELSKKHIPLNKLILFCDHFNISIERVIKEKNLAAMEYENLLAEEDREDYKTRLDRMEDRLDRIEATLKMDSSDE